MLRGSFREFFFRLTKDSFAWVDSEQRATGAIIYRDGVFCIQTSDCVSAIRINGRNLTVGSSGDLADGDLLSVGEARFTVFIE